MSVATSQLLWRARVLLARAQQRVGWAGVAGIALMLSALTVVFLAGSSRPILPIQVDQPGVAAPQVVAPPPAAQIAQIPQVLPSRADAMRLLEEIQRVAVANGLGWPAADYRFVAATADKPPSLEVLCALKGPYLQLRRMLTQLLRTVPAFTLRELSISRPASDSVNIEAKLVMVAFLRDEADRGTAIRQEPPR